MQHSSADKTTAQPSKAAAHQATRKGGISYPAVPAFGTPEVIQRRVSHRVNQEDKYKADFNTVVDNLNTAVEKAFLYAIHDPTLSAYAGIDGHTEYWVDCWKNFLATGNTNLLSAAFGYVVETLATVIYLAGAPGGLEIELQGIRGDTRPDLILKDGKTDVGWLDITSDGSDGHIWNKAGWKNKAIHISEVTYPVFNPAVVEDNVAHGRKYDDKTDSKEVLSRVAYFKWIQEVRRIYWKKIGAKFFGDPFPGANKTKKRQYIRERVAAYLGLPSSELPPLVLSSVMYAMGQGLGKHGYDSLAVNRAAGEHFLQAHDPNLPGVEGYSPTIAASQELIDAKQREIMAQFEAAGERVSVAVPDVSDTDLAVVSEGTDPVFDGVVARFKPQLNKTATLNYFDVKKLLSGMSEFAISQAMKSFAIKVRFGDGSTEVIKVNDAGLGGLKGHYLRKAKKTIADKAKRAAIIEGNRDQGRLLDSIGSPSADLALGRHEEEDTDIDLLNEPQEYTFLAFGFETNDGHRMAMGNDDSGLLEEGQL